MPNQKILNICRHNAVGACLAELSISLPLLLIFLLGIADLGQQVGQMPWFSRVTYETAIRGAEIDSQTGPGQMSSSFQGLYASELSGTANHMHSAVLSNVSSYLNNNGPSPYDSTDRTVTAVASGVAKGFFASLPLDFDFNYVAALLTKNSSASFAVNSSFQNDSHCVYDCNGNCTSSVATQACTYWSASARCDLPGGVCRPI